MGALLIATPSRGLTTPSDEEMRSIAALLQEGARRDEEARNTRDIGASAKTLSPAENARDVLMTSAIKRVLTAFRIVPQDAEGNLIMPGGISAYAENAGAMIHFTPVYAPRLATEHWVIADGIPTLLKGSRGGPRAYTTFTGSTVIHELTVDPRYLALVLYHERLHFEQFIDPAQANLPVTEREVRAMKATFAAIPLVGLSNDRGVRNEVSAAIREFRDKAAYQNSFAGRVHARLRRLKRRIHATTEGHQAEYSVRPSADSAAPDSRPSLPLAIPLPPEAPSTLPDALALPPEAAPSPTVPPQPEPEYIEEKPAPVQRGSYNPCIEPGRTCFR